MHKKMHIIFALLVFLPFSLSAKKLAVPIYAEAGIVMNADTGVILFEKNIHEQHYPASIAKIATAIYALNTTSSSLDTMITAQKDALGTIKEDAMRRSNYTLPAYYLFPDASHIGLKDGEIISFKDLLYGLLIRSGGDAANVIAKHVGGTIPDFMKGVNEYLKQIGCTSTTLCNPHGLHNPNQVTTAYDMALLAREGLKNPIFREVVSTVHYTRPKTNKQDATPWIQTNRLMRIGPYYYPKAIGIKTGYYFLAGSTLIAAAKDGDRTLIVVLLKEKERKDVFNDAIKLFEAAFAQPKMQKVLLKKGSQKFLLDLPGAPAKLSTFTKEDLVVEYYPAEEPELKCFLQWDRALSLPITQGQVIGEVLLQMGDGQKIATATLYAAEDLQATFLHRIGEFFQRWLSGPSKVIALLLAVMGGGYFIYRRFFVVRR